MPIDPGPSDHETDGGGEGSLLSMVLAIIISVIIVFAVVSTSRRHAVALDEGVPPAATAPAQPAAPPAP